MRFAVIDLGTNTVRLLVGEPDGGGGTARSMPSRPSRAWAGMLAEARLQPEAVGRTWRCWPVPEEAEPHGASRIAVVGRARCAGPQPRGVPGAGAPRGGSRYPGDLGREEARLTLLGVAPPCIWRTPFVLMDIGAAAPSSSWPTREHPASVSTGLGSVVLTEAYLRSDPPPPGTRGRPRRGARRAGPAAGRPPRTWQRCGRRGPMLRGNRGTVTTLAAIDLALEAYDPDRINGHRLSGSGSRSSARGWRPCPRPTPAAPRLEPARADVIVAGALVSLAAVDPWGSRDDRQRRRYARDPPRPPRRAMRPASDPRPAGEEH